MFSVKKLIVLQLICILAVTYVAYEVGSYFPNLPPFIRVIVQNIEKKRITIVKSNYPDERFLKWFNRDPDRVIPLQPNIIVSPADGYVIFTKVYRGMKHVVIEMRYTDVHVQRVPIDGIVVMIEGEGKELPGDNIGDYTLNKMIPYQKITTLAT